MMKMRKKSNAYSDKRMKLIQKYINIKNKIILDIGCGIGDHCQYFQMNEGKIIGLDLRPSNISKAHHRNKNIHYIIGDALNTSIRTSVIELVLINEVLEHVPNDEKLIQESNRILQKDGHLAIFAPNKLYPFEGHWGPGPFNIFPFLSWVPTQIRKWVFKLFKKKYLPIYTRSRLKEMINPFFNIIKISEILPSFDRYRKRKSFNKIIRIIDALSETPLKRLGVSIFIIASAKPMKR